MIDTSIHVYIHTYIYKIHFYVKVLHLSAHVLKVRQHTVRQCYVEKNSRKLVSEQELQTDEC